MHVARFPDSSPAFDNSEMFHRGEMAQDLHRLDGSRSCHLLGLVVLQQECAVTARPPPKHFNEPSSIAVRRGGASAAGRAVKPVVKH
jgi:hypothetical protein